MRHTPSVAGAVEAFFANRDLAAETCRTYRMALDSLVEGLGGDCSVADLDADRVAAVFAELWGGCAAATWNTRRVAVGAFGSWCGERWLLAGDPLLGVEPRRRSDNIRAILVGDLDRARRRARIRCKGGSIGMVVWAAPITRFLGRCLADWTVGPLFLIRWRTRTVPSRRDLYAPAGQARLSSVDILVGGPSTSCAIRPLRIWPNPELPR